MIIHTDFGRVLLTTHAIERYRSRIDRKARAGDICNAVWRATVRPCKPSWVEGSAKHGRGAAAWLVGEGWAAPLRHPDPALDQNDGSFDYAALTVIKRRVVPKADLRARREQSREDARYAA